MSRCRSFTEGCGKRMSSHSGISQRPSKRGSQVHLQKSVFASLAKMRCRRFTNKAVAAGLEVYLITDNGKTEFHGRPTRTCLAIGPDDAEGGDPITGDLELS